MAFKDFLASFRWQGSESAGSTEVGSDYRGPRKEHAAGQSGLDALSPFELFHVSNKPVLVEDVHVSMDLDPQGNIVTCKIEKLVEPLCPSAATKDTFPRSKRESASALLVEVPSTRGAEHPIVVDVNGKTASRDRSRETKTPTFTVPCPRSSSASVSSTASHDDDTGADSTAGTRPQALPGRVLQAKDFKQVKLLGHSSGGLALLVNDTVTDKVLVMKAIRKKNSKRNDRLAIYSEQHTLKRLVGNPLFTELRGSFEDSKYFYLLMDYVPRGDLTSYLAKKCDVDLARSLMAELAVALESLHAMRVVHRDVKPANILVDNNYHVVLADFGLSRDFGHAQYELPWFSEPRRQQPLKPCGDETEGWIGTTGYVAPEVYCDKHSYKADIWSAGVVLFQLLSGELPFGIAFPQETIEVMRRTVMLPLELDGIEDAAARSLLGMMLHKDPSKRATWSEIKAHPFFKTINWEALSQRAQGPTMPNAGQDVQTTRSPIIQYGEPCKPGRQDAPWFYWISPALQPPLSVTAPPSPHRAAQNQAHSTGAKLPSSSHGDEHRPTPVKVGSNRVHAWTKQLFGDLWSPSR